MPGHGPSRDMTLAPLLTASLAVQVHAFAAMAAFALGIVQLSAPKGTAPHRALGWIWALLMGAVGISAFFIHTIRLWGPWSPIHLLAIFTLISLFFGALVIAGLFTFVPGRIMHAVAFGR